MRHEEQRCTCLIQQCAQVHVVFDELSFTGVTDGDQHKTAGGNVETAPPDEAPRHTRFIEKRGFTTGGGGAVRVGCGRFAVMVRCTRDCHTRSVCLPCIIA